MFPREHGVDCRWRQNPFDLQETSPHGGREVMTTTMPAILSWSSANAEGWNEGVRVHERAIKVKPMKGRQEERS